MQYKINHSQLVISARQFACNSMLLVMVMLVSTNLWAEQVEVTGKAKIVNGDIDKAREDAISQALSYASLKAGVNFSSEQQIDDGQLTKTLFKCSA